MQGNWVVEIGWQMHRIEVTGDICSSRPRSTQGCRDNDDDDDDDIKYLNPHGIGWLTKQPPVVFMSYHEPNTQPPFLYLIYFFPIHEISGAILSFNSWTVILMICVDSFLFLQATNF
jgi:hypothetical protein